MYKRQDQSDPCHSAIKEYIQKNYTYPTEDSPLGLQNRLNSPISTSIYNEQGELKSEEYHYKDFGANVLAIEKVDFKGRGGLLKSSATITKRNDKGTILEVISPTGVYTSYIYAYGGRYLVAELVNVSYATLEAATNSLDISLDSLIQSNSEALIKTQTHQLRNYLTAGQITSYTHIPLVGISQIIDVRGREMTYTYDGYNRLVFIKDHDGNIVSKNTYNYKN